MLASQDVVKPCGCCISTNDKSPEPEDTIISENVQEITMLLPIRKEITQRISNNGKLAVKVPKNECLLTILKKCRLIKTFDI